jgi:hypothetical protein
MGGNHGGLDAGPGEGRGGGQDGQAEPGPQGGGPGPEGEALAGEPEPASGPEGGPEAVGLGEDRQTQGAGGRPVQNLGGGQEEAPGLLVLVEPGGRLGEV